VDYAQWPDIYTACFKIVLYVLYL